MRTEKPVAKRSYKSQQASHKVVAQVKPMRESAERRESEANSLSASYSSLQGSSGSSPASSPTDEREENRESLPGKTSSTYSAMPPSAKSHETAHPSRASRLPAQPPPPPPFSHFHSYVGFPTGPMQSHPATQDNSSQLRPTVHPLAHRPVAHPFAHATSQLLPHATAQSFPSGHPGAHLISPYPINPIHHPFSFSHAVAHPVTHQYGHLASQTAAGLAGNLAVFAPNNLLDAPRDHNQGQCHQCTGGADREGMARRTGKNDARWNSVNGHAGVRSNGIKDMKHTRDNMPMDSDNSLSDGSMKKERIAYVNGSLVNAERAHIPITDFGFAYGCAIVEEVLVLKGRTMRLDAHLDLFITSANVINLPVPLSRSDMKKTCKHIVATNSDGERGALYIHLSFGAYGSRSRRLPPSGSLMPSLVIHTQPIEAVSEKHVTEGISLYPAPDHRPSISDPHEPSVAYVSSSQLPEILALQSALKNDCQEAVLYDLATDDVSGTTQGNIFCVKFGVLYTPPALGRVPDGVMRRHVLKVCGREKIDACEVNITRPFLSSASEVFCTSNLDEVLPVRAVGDRVIGDGKPGPITKKVMATLNVQRSTSLRRRSRPDNFVQQSRFTRNTGDSDQEDPVATQKPRQSSSSSRGNSSSTVESNGNESQGS